MTAVVPKMTKAGNRAQRLLNGAILVVAVLFALVLATTMILTQRNNSELENILEESVKAELLASCFGAREVVLDHLELFNNINSEADVDRYRAEYDATIARLELLRTRIGAEYIYVLKLIDGKYYFIFDTDTEAMAGHDDSDPKTEGLITEYTGIEDVHLEAFAGVPNAGVMNVQDEWGSYNTGAVPLLDPDTREVIGVVSTDITDIYIAQFRQTSTTSSRLLMVVMGAAMVVLLAVLIALNRRNSRMQADLYRLANHDAITGLPNRHYLFTYLAEKREALEKTPSPFAVFFVDLDNFKRVNDSAGHDAGDELLRSISEFLSTTQQGYAACALNPENPGTCLLDALTARIGGDEFLQITPGISSAAEAEAVATSMLTGFKAQNSLKPFIRDYEVGLSIGIALFPEQSADCNELMKLSDIAMYHAKYNGKNNYALYTPEMGDSVEGQSLSIR
ncbi:MAG: GGDEF domain-containing protein [Coriobacteriales bacterium]|nr:GGDEF domain-containing protein [Coriobacteriales bacterium]